MISRRIAGTTIGDGSADVEEDFPVQGTIRSIEIDGTNLDATADITILVRSSDTGLDYTVFTLVNNQAHKMEADQNPNHTHKLA